MITKELLEANTQKLKNLGINQIHLETIRYMALAFTNKEIANKLCVSEKAVKFRCTFLFKKLKARNRVDFLNKCEALLRNMIIDESIYES